MIKSFLIRVLLSGLAVFGFSSVEVAALAQRVSLETAVIRPTIPGASNWRMEFSHGRIRIENRSIRDLIKAAYGLSADSQVMNAPAWALHQRFDVNGTFDATATKDIDNGTAAQRNIMVGGLLQGLLMDRFKLKVHSEKVMMPVYALTVSRRGVLVHATESRQGSTFYGIVGPAGKLDGHGVSMATLASRLTSMKDAGERLVIDETGMSGEFDWSLRWNSDLLSATSGTAESDSPSLFTALEEQLGLKLVSKKGEVSAVVIDQVSQPSEN